MSSIEGSSGSAGSCSSPTAASGTSESTACSEPCEPPPRWLAPPRVEELEARRRRDDDVARVDAVEELPDALERVRVGRRARRVAACSRSSAARSPSIVPAAAAQVAVAARRARKRSSRAVAPQRRRAPSSRQAATSTRRPLEHAAGELVRAAPLVQPVDMPARFEAATARSQAPGPMRPRATNRRRSRERVADVVVALDRATGRDRRAGRRA